jgi:hypothetical protein
MARDANEVHNKRPCRWLSLSKTHRRHWPRVHVCKNKHHQYISQRASQAEKKQSQKRHNSRPNHIPLQSFIMGPTPHITLTSVPFYHRREDAKKKK